MFGSLYGMAPWLTMDGDNVSIGITFNGIRDGIPFKLQSLSTEMEDD